MWHELILEPFKQADREFGSYYSTKFFKVCRCIR
jgi:hypothetical protein